MTVVVAKNFTIYLARNAIPFVLNSRRLYETATDVYGGLRDLTNTFWRWYRPNDQAPNQESNGETINESNGESNIRQVIGECSVCRNQLRITDENERDDLSVAIIRLQRCEHEFHFHCLMTHINDVGLRCPICEIRIIN